MNFADEFYAAWPTLCFDPLALARVFRAVGHLEGRLFFVGNGGSAAIASHMANDFSKNGGLKCLAFNDGASLTCLANDLGYDTVFSHPINRHIEAGDCLVAISSSGRSKNIINAAASAIMHKAKVVTLTGFDAVNPLRAYADTDLDFWVNSQDYGIVETMHLGMLHATLRELPNVRG